MYLVKVKHKGVEEYRNEIKYTIFKVEKGDVLNKLKSSLDRGVVPLTTTQSTAR